MFQQKEYKLEYSAEYLSFAVLNLFSLVTFFSSVTKK